MKNKYEKYLSQIIKDSNTYYLVSGSDLSNKGEEDFVLCDYNGKILLFDERGKIKDYILCKITIDNDNLRQWVCQIEKEPVYIIINLDSIQNISKQNQNLSELEDYQIHEIFELLCIMKDYSYSNDPAYYNNLISSNELDTFWNYYYDKYIWKDQKESALKLAEGLEFKKLSNILKQLVEEFYLRSIIL